MTTETKTAAATLRTTGLTIDYQSTMCNDLSTFVGIDEDGDIIAGGEVVVAEATREAALAIAEAFTRLAQELPEAPTDD